MLKLQEICKMCRFPVRYFSITPVYERSIVAGKYKTTKNQTFPLTYEMVCPPPAIGHYKSWNSWNTSAVYEWGLRKGETAVEDEFIRKFIRGTWHRLVLTEIIVKRTHNIIRVASIVYQGTHPRKMYFLIGYTEEMLSYWLQCPVKLELQTVSDRKAVIYKYI